MPDAREAPLRSPTTAGARGTTRTAAKPRITDGKLKFYRGDDYRIEESIGYLMRLGVASVLRNADRELKKEGLTGVQVLPLLAIAQGKAVNASELSRLVGTDPGAATRMLDRLQAKGLVRRARSTHDRRVVRLEVTAAGQKIAARIPRALANVLNRHLRGFTRTEFEQLRTLLARVIANGNAAG